MFTVVFRRPDPINDDYIAGLENAGRLFHAKDR